MVACWLHQHGALEAVQVAQPGAKQAKQHPGACLPKDKISSPSLVAALLAEWEARRTCATGAAACLQPSTPQHLVVRHFWAHAQSSTVE